MKLLHLRLGLRCFGWFLPCLGTFAAENSLAVAERTINAADLMRHTRTLASDEFEGRAPGTAGEERTVQYLVDQFRSMGLKPGNPDGSWIQEVPMVGVKSEISGKLGAETLTFPQDYVAWSPREDREVSVEGSELVFVGYGVVAPEYGWDDYKGADIRGKTLVMLINDPPVPDPKDPAKLDERMFKGKAMTYYGRWTYKFEIAAAKGAAAAIIIHETQPAAYPWFVVVNSWSRERFALEGDTSERVNIASWISLERAEKLFASQGSSYQAMKRAAVSREFRPIPLGVKAEFHSTQTVRHARSRNVVALREGSDARRRSEYVVYTAHWDHLGRNPQLAGDTIFNGASDNAIGTAGLLELAEAAARAPEAPRRSLLFVALTAEEQGLLGAAYYAAHPLYPINRTVANLNMDRLNTWGRTRDVSVIGLGQSTLDDVLLRFARERGRAIRPEPAPEKGSYYRSDHFEFAKVGVPALYIKGGDDYIGKPEGYGKQREDEYTERDYHKVSDELKPDWDLSGAVEDLQLLLRVGWQVAGDRRWPEWKKGSEFRERRQKMLRGTR